MTIREDSPTALGFAQGEREQTADTIDSAMARVRHAIERMRYTTHATLKRGACVFIPGIAMSSTYADSMHVKIFDRLERSRQFWRNRDAFDHIGVLDQLLDMSR